MSDQYDKDQNDNQLEGFEEGPASPVEQKTGPRPFVVAISIIGGIFVLALILLGAYILLNPGRNTAADAQRINTQNTAIAQAATDQSRAAALQATLDAAPKPATNTPIVVQGASATPTSVVAIATATNTALPSSTALPADARTQTAVALTQIAQGTKPVGGAGSTPGVGTLAAGTPGAGTPGAGTPGAGTPRATTTGLPNTGFADQVGLPAMVGAAVLLLVIIFIARRVRLSN